MKKRHGIKVNSPLVSAMKRWALDHAKDSDVVSVSAVIGYRDDHCILMVEGDRKSASRGLMAIFSKLSEDQGQPPEAAKAAE